MAKSADIFVEQTAYSSGESRSRLKIGRPWALLWLTTLGKRETELLRREIHVENAEFKKRTAENEIEMSTVLSK